MLGLVACGQSLSTTEDSQIKSGSSQDSLEAAEASHNGSTHGFQDGQYANNSMVNQPISAVPISTAGTTVVLPGPTTNLNIGMDYWGGATSSTIPAMRGQVSPPITGGTVSAGARDNVQSQLWLQDERELKRQKRKQSNRESARRSRLRKQAECDELAQHSEALKEENASLRVELSHFRSEYEKVVAQNVVLKV